MALLLYGFPPGVGATGTAALLNVPASLEALLRTLAAVRGGCGARRSVLVSRHATLFSCPAGWLVLGPTPPSHSAPTPTRLHQEGYDLGDVKADHLDGLGEAVVTALKAQEDQRAIAGGWEGAAGCAPAADGRRENLSDGISGGPQVSAAGARHARGQGQGPGGDAGCTHVCRPIAPPSAWPAEGAAGVLRRGAGSAAAYGAKPSAVDIEPRRLKEMLTFPDTWGPTEWGACCCLLVCLVGRVRRGLRCCDGNAQLAPLYLRLANSGHGRLSLPPASPPCPTHPARRRPHPLPARE